MSKILLTSGKAGKGEAGVISFVHYSLAVWILDPTDNGTETVPLLSSRIRGIRWRYSYTKTIVKKIAELF